MKVQFILQAIVLLACGFSHAQTDVQRIKERLAASVQLDSVVIVASASGFDVEDFIQLVLDDQSLYRAFRNLRKSAHRLSSDMTFKNRKGDTKASYHNSANQKYDGKCRSMTIQNEQIEGKFFKKKRRKYRYYTARLYDRVFITHGQVCNEPGLDVRLNTNSNPEDKFEGRVNELKKLIFTPGKKSKVPLIGNKTEIFSDQMIALYDFEIHSGEFNGIPVYTFTAREKPEYASKENKTVFKFLITHFAKKDFQVIARTYTLSQRTALYMFDVTMHTELTKYEDKYYPVLVRYEGEWNIPGRKKEIGAFEVRLSGFN